MHQKQLAQRRSTPNGCLSPHEFASFLRNLWPSFVYFDSFQDILPREVSVTELVAQAADVSQSGIDSRTIPQSVFDFIELSDINLKRVSQLSDQDKALGNYLQSCGTKITGDFLTYWKQRG